MNRKSNIWEDVLGVTIWGVGAFIIYLGWHFHFDKDWLDQIWGLALYVVAFFYFLALPKCLELAIELVERFRKYFGLI